MNKFMGMLVNEFHLSIRFILIYYVGFAIILVINHFFDRLLGYGVTHFADIYLLVVIPSVVLDSRYMSYATQWASFVANFPAGRLHSALVPYVAFMLVLSCSALVWLGLLAVGIRSDSDFLLFYSLVACMLLAIYMPVVNWVRSSFNRMMILLATLYASMYAINSFIRILPSLYLFIPVLAACLSLSVFISRALLSESDRYMRSVF